MFDRNAVPISFALNPIPSMLKDRCRASNLSSVGGRSRVRSSTTDHNVAAVNDDAIDEESHLTATAKIEYLLQVHPNTH